MGTVVLPCQPPSPQHPAPLRTILGQQGAVLVPRLPRSRLPPALPERFGTHVPLPGQGKALSSSPGKNRAPTLPSPAPACQKKHFSALPRLFSCCPHHFAGQVLPGKGPDSLLQRSVHLGQAIGRGCFFINNKLGVIAISTAATPRPGEAPSRTGARRSSPTAREPRHPQPHSRPHARQQQ